MKTDTYTKFLLTLIALSLLYLCGMQSGAQLLAQPVRNIMNPLPAQPVIVVGYGHLDPKAPGGVAIAWTNERDGIGDRTVPVRVLELPHESQRHVVIDSAPQLSVSVDAVKKGSPWDPIRTEVDRQPSLAKPGGGQ
jgi:hypothetical protein